MKVLALHLPAFHRIPENDEWWGDGFTEWDNVRRGKPLYRGHVQPLVPIDHYYYDLSKKQDVEHQASIAKEYGLSGFIFYHYWFSGKLLLEKPIEIFRDDKDINFEYCLCWANEPWARTWDGKTKQVLMPQTFGDVDDWESHFQYFLSFFDDKRYIKLNNMPMLYIYSPSRIPNFDEMMAYWNKRAIENGFNGIYLVEFISTINPNAHSKYSKAVTEFEPMYTNRFEISAITKAYRLFCKKFKLTEYLDYDDIWKRLLRKNRTYDGRSIIQGCFTHWDNTPRRAKAGTVFKGGSPEKFEKYFKHLLNNKRKDASSEYIIINAWNEWGEGAILEPSEQYGYKYLEGVRNAVEEMGER